MKTNTNANGVELNVSAQILNLAESFQKEFKIGEGGVIEVPKDLFERTLPDGLSMNDVKRVHDHTSAVVSALGLATGNVGLAAFKKDKKLDQVSVEMGLCKDKVAAVFQRSKQVPDGKGEQQTKFGVLSARYVVSGAKPTSGSYKKVREHLALQAAAAFGAK